jgi:protein TonB
MTNSYSQRGISQIGALELKRAYQKNLFQAELAVLLLAIAIISSISLTSHFGKEPVKPPKTYQVVPDSVVTFIQPPQVEPPKGQPIKVAPPKQMTILDPEPEPDTDYVLPEKIAISGPIGNGTDTAATVGITPEPLGISGAYSPEPVNSDTFVYVTEWPTPISVPKPKYPEIARKAGIEASISVRVHLDITGHVIEAKIDKSSGTEVGFEEAALEAAKLAVWRPAMQNKQPVSLWISYPVRFTLR